MIKFYKDLKSTLKTASKLVFVASADSYKNKSYEVLLGDYPELTSTLEPELKKLKSESKGKKLETYTSHKTIREVRFVCLPNKVSRNNSPTCRQAVFEQLQNLGSASDIAVVCVLSNKDYYAAFAGAIARHEKLYSRKTGKGTKPKNFHLIAFDEKAKLISANSAVKATAAGVSWAAKMVDTPPEELNPKTFAAAIKKWTKNEGVKFKEISGQKLLDESLGGIHAVGRCATESPRMVIADYNPKGAKKTILLVGKGLTYDSGGLSLKISGSMVGMKCDMGGAAAVVGAFKALVDCKESFRVIAIVGAVENAIGPNAYRNDDILTMHSGKTVEVNNTDAEGRIVLADCVSYGCRKYQPDLVIDAATLTGAQMIATGLLHAGIVSNRDTVETLAVQTGKETGDLVCALPFAPEFFKAELASTVADMRNSVKNRLNAQSSCAAQFIYNHIEDLDVPWLHIDLAGPATTASGKGTGYGVSLIAEVARRFKN